MILVNRRNLIKEIKRNFHSKNADFKSFTQWYRELWHPRGEAIPPYVHVVQVGDPILRQSAKSVPDELIKSKEISFLVQRMKHVMKKYNCVGLAAPQLGIPLRVITVEFNQKTKEKFSAEVFKTREMELLPLTTFINPVITITNFEKKSFVEACESVKGYSAEVPRYHEINITGKNCNNELIELNLKGWNARIVQHEMDHLNGKLFTDIMKRDTFICTFWQVVNFREGRIKMPFSPM